MDQYLYYLGCGLFMLSLFFVFFIREQRKDSLTFEELRGEIKNDIVINLQRFHDIRYVVMLSSIIITAFMFGPFYNL